MRAPGGMAEAGLELHRDRVLFLSHDYHNILLIASDVRAASVDEVEQSCEGLGFTRISDRYINSTSLEGA
jgi:hypothetical protein